MMMARMTFAPATMFNMCSIGHRASTTSGVATMVFSLAIVCYCSYKIERLMKAVSNSPDGDVDRPQETRRTGVFYGKSNLYNLDDISSSEGSTNVYSPSKILHVERTLGCLIICLCFISMLYTALFIRMTLKGLYDVFMPWTMFIVLTIISGTIFIVYDSVVNQFAGATNAALMIWCFMVALKIQCVRVVFPRYKAFKLTRANSNSIDENCRDVGDPPPLYDISSDVSTAPGELDLNPPEYEPVMHPPSYSEVTQSTEIIMNPMLQEVPKGKPPKYKP